MPVLILLYRLICTWKFLVESQLEHFIRVFSPYDPDNINRCSSSSFSSWPASENLSDSMTHAKRLVATPTIRSPRPALFFCRLSDISIALKSKITKLHIYNKHKTILWLDLAMKVQTQFSAQDTTHYCISTLGFWQWLDKFTWRCPFYLSYCHNYQQIFHRQREAHISTFGGTRQIHLAAPT